MQAARGARPVGRPARILLATGAAVLAADQISKAFAVARLEEGIPIRALDGIVYWTLQRNPGAAFGLFRRLPALFTVLAVVVSVSIVAVARRERSRWSAVALGLALGGALGNLADRIARPPGPFRGRVIDFIDLRVWPTFNLADAAIVAGAAMILLGEMRRGRTTPLGEREASPAGTDDG